MGITERLDGVGKPAWIALLVVSFIVFWPLGLALLAYLHWSGRMGCGRFMGRFDAQNWRQGMRSGRGRWYHTASSGNAAFDEYREETLRRLEDEQREFHAFLDRLRHAKDKAEFDLFMAERRRPQEPPASPEE